MTVRELYEYAKEKGILDYDIMVPRWFDDGYDNASEANIEIKEKFKEIEL